MEQLCKKTKYSSKEYAEFGIVHIQEKSFKAKIPVRAYLCEKCKCWHLTSKPDYFELQKEIELLKERNKELENVVKENELLKEKNKELGNLSKSESYNNANRDNLVQKLHEAISNKDKIIKNLRKTNEELVIKNIHEK
jgi:hypothetical protein